MRNNIKDEIRYIKSMFRRIEENKLTVGDRFSVDDFNMYPNSIYCSAEGPYLMSMVNRGILKVVDKELVKFNSHGTKTITPEEFIRNIKKGKIDGTYYTRNVYEIKSDNFKEYITKLIEEMCE